MRWRDVVLRENHTLADTGTVITDINIVDPITAILIKVENQNGATSCQDVRVHEDIDKIELVDGSEVIFSMSMKEAMALNFYETGKLPYFLWTEAAAAIQYDTCWIFFGKKLGDKLLYLDPKRFKNLTLKITHSFTVSATAGFEAGKGKLTIIAKVAEAGVPEAPAGLKMSKNIYSWSTAGDGDERVEFPVDYDHIGFMLRVFATTVGMEEHISRVKITVDEDKYIPLDLRMLDLLPIQNELFGEAAIAQELFKTDGDTVESRIGYPNFYALNAKVDMDLASIDAEDDGNLTLQVIKQEAAANSKEAIDVALNLITRGLCPFNTIYWLWDPLNRPNHHLVVDRLKSVVGKFTQATAAGAASIITQQVKR